MDGLLLRTGLHGIGTSSISVTTSGNLEVRPNLQPHFPSVGRSQQLTTVASAASGSSTISVGEGIPVTTAATSKFTFRYPFTSLLPWVNNKQGASSSTMKGVALDDAVLADSARPEGNGGRGGKPEDIDDSSKVVDFEDSSKVVDFQDSKRRNGNWVFQILRVKSLWSEDAGTEKQTEMEENLNLDSDLDLGSDDQQIGDSASSSGCGGEEDEFCEACQSGDHKEFDRDSFSKLLKKVPLSEAKLYAQLSYLGNLAYDIPSIKQRNLLKRHRLRYVTSSIEKREQMMVSSSEKKEEEEEDQITTNTTTTAAKEEQTPTTEKLDTTTCTETDQEQPAEEQRNAADDHGPRISAAAAFHIAASAASFLNSRTRSILFSASESAHASGGEEHEDELGGGGDGEEEEEEKGQGNGEHVVTESSDMDMASLMATTDSVTAVVSAKEEVKQAVADDLSSISCAPCEWYTCDDERSATRFFVIQGSESVASWQANLLFEPTEFEDLGVYVHRGIYEAAKGMYQQMLPEIHTHIQSHGPNAKFRFTGHSLGGSLSLLINLMLLIRGDVPTVASLLPVVTFGSPCVMCGGNNLLQKLGLRRNHIQAITMHRDIVPRAFSCHYPNHVAEILKAINGNFRSHPCLNQEHKLLFAPMGELVILQPDSSLSPQHELLPEESGMYVLTCDEEEAGVVAAAERSFLNTPHPLEILSDRGAYGNGGTIQRDHDMNSYLRCVRTVIRKELNQIRKVEREGRRKVWWPMVTPRVVSGGGMLVGRGPRSNYNWQGMLRNGSESFKRRFSRVVASQHMHLLVVLLFPAKLLLVGVHSVMGFR